MPDRHAAPPPSRFYKGFPVVRMARHSNGTLPVCLVTCRECGNPHEKGAKTISDSLRNKRPGFLCDECRGLTTRRNSCVVCRVEFDVTHVSRKNLTCGPECAKKRRLESAARFYARRRA